MRHIGREEESCDTAVAVERVVAAFRRKSLGERGRAATFLPLPPNGRERPELERFEREEEGCDTMTLCLRGTVNPLERFEREGEGCDDDEGQSRNVGARCRKGLREGESCDRESESGSTMLRK